MSKGEIVPDVMTTEENRSNTGAIANEGSRHLHISHDLANGRDVHCVKDWIRNSSMLSLIWFQNQEETLLIRRNKSTERSDFLQCVVLVDIRQFKCTDK
jgi:hypothetical protein